MRPLILILGASLVLSPFAAMAAPAAPAATGAVAEDARCLMTMAAFTGAKDPNTSSSAQFGVAYFAGRIKARDPSFDLGSRLKTVADSMSGKDMQAEANRCGPMVLQALRELEAAQSTMRPAAPAAAVGKPATPGAAPARPPAAPPKAP